MITFETKKHDQLADKSLQKGPSDRGFRRCYQKLSITKNVLLN